MQSPLLSREAKSEGSAPALSSGLLRRNSSNSSSGWDDFMATSAMESATATAGVDGPGSFATGGGAVKMKDVRAGIRTIRGSVGRDTRRRGGGTAGPNHPPNFLDAHDADSAGTHIRPAARRRRCCNLCGCNPMLVRRPGTRQIIGYSTDAVTTLAFLRTTGTVLASRFIWIQTAGLAAICILVFIVGHLTQCFAGLSTEKFASIVTFMNGLTTFILSLFISLTLARWWALRYSCLGELWNQVAELTTLASSYLSDNDEQRRLRDGLIRYSLLSHALVFKQAQGRDEKSPDGPLFTELRSRGLVTHAEARHLADHAVKAEVPWVWCFKLIARAVKTGLLEPGLRYDFHVRALKGRSAVTNIFVYIHTKLPLLYVHMIVLLVKLTMILWAFQTGIVMAQSANEENTGTSSADILPNFALQLFVPLIYQSALELHRKLHNPFLEHSSGFPERTYLSAMRSQCSDIRAAADAVESFFFDDPAGNEAANDDAAALAAAPESAAPEAAAAAAAAAAASSAAPESVGAAKNA